MAASVKNGGLHGCETTTSLLPVPATRGAVAFAFVPHQLPNHATAGCMALQIHFCLAACLLQIETDKVTVDVRAPKAGIVEAILVRTACLDLLYNCSRFSRYQPH